MKQAQKDKKIKKVEKYLPSEIEKKWNQKWEEAKLYDFKLDPKRENYYVLVELPYSSGDLHIGHWFTWTTPDVFARFKRMQGYNVFFPIGFDSFGLPAENAAIKRHIHPQEWTLNNIKSMTKQFETMGTMMTWEKVAITCLPEYYKWNQWIFLKMYEKGIAYRGQKSSNWCPACQTVLADENVESGKCWRCGTEVVQKEVEQWFLKITDYADRLLWGDKPEVDWPESVRTGQNNWIGRSEGARVSFPIVGESLSDTSSSKVKRGTTQNINAEKRGSDSIEVFTTRPDTLFGATFMVVAPEHPLVAELGNSKFEIRNSKLNEVKDYVEKAKRKSELERKENKEKTGVFTGLYAINPVNNEQIPIWVADYVLPGYGTGAIMAVPAHDERDFEFAKKFNLPVVEVISGGDIEKEPYTGEGVIVNSNDWDGWKNSGAMGRVIDWLEKKGIGKKEVGYHLRDWSISRQRYWGTPIPMIHCEKCGIVPVPEDQLPIELPYNVDYTPQGKPPLASNEEWLKATCPKCGEEGKRDAETMDTFIDSSWYYYRYVSPDYQEAPFDKERMEKLMPVDIYFGGAEHTLGHTLYARFFTKFFHDLGMVPFDEFAKKRIQHGIVLGSDGDKMSKSKGNVINPDDVVRDYGADAVRIYLSFMMPYEATGPWSTTTMAGMYRFLRRIWELQSKVQSSKLKVQNYEDKIKMNKVIKKVTEDLGAIKMNTAVAALMDWLNYLSRKDEVSIEEYSTMLLLLAPFAPYTTEELWFRIHTDEKRICTDLRESIHLQSWPSYDPKLASAGEVTIAIQINGRLRDTMVIESSIPIKSGSKLEMQNEIERTAKELQNVKKYLEGKEIKKTIYVKGKILNFVI